MFHSAMAAFKHVCKQYVAPILGIDSRSLVLFRVLVGLLIIADVLMRSTDLVAHYTDFGVLPRAALLQHFMYPTVVCVHLAVGTTLGVACLFVLQAVVAALLVVGWQTRRMTVLSWFLLYSVHVRNPMVLQAGDDLLRMLLFWAIFLPWGDFYSWDAAKTSVVSTSAPANPQAPVQVFSVATLAVLGQVLLMYVCTAQLKTGTPWHEQGTAVHDALHFDQLVLPLGVFLRQFDAFTTICTHLVMFWETYGPCLLLLPNVCGRLRTLGVLSFVLMHFAFAACLMLGLFPWIDLASLVIFLPAWFWQQPWLRSRCCFLPQGNPRPAHVRVFKERPWVFYVGPQIFVGVLFVAVVVWNISTLPQIAFRVPPFWNPVFYTLRIDQDWGMFSPHPQTEDGWYVIEGQRADLQKVDVYRQITGPVDLAKPVSVSAMYGNQRWGKYMMNLWLIRNSQHRLYFSQYLCRRYNGLVNQPGPHSLLTFDILFMQEITRSGVEPGSIEKKTLWQHNCFAKN